LLFNQLKEADAIQRVFLNILRYPENTGQRQEISSDYAADEALGLSPLLIRRALAASQAV
jgi:hypothetical protein